MTDEDATRPDDALALRLAAVKAALPLVSVADTGSIDFPPHSAGSALAWTPLPERERVDVGGRDRAKFLQGLVSNDVVGLRPGAGCHSALLDVKGKFQVEFGISAAADGFLLDVPAGYGAFLVATLDRYLFRDKVELIDRGGGQVATIVQGDEEAIASRFGTAPDRAPWSRVDASVEAGAVSLVRDPWTEGVRVWAETDVAAALWTAWQAHDATTLAGTARVHAERIRRGLPIFPIDIDGGNIALEAGSLDIVSFTKGCYLGQEVIARVDSRGAVNKHVVALRFEDIDEPVGARIVAPVDDDRAGRVLGTVTSAAYVDGEHLGLGTVRRGYETPGTRLPLHDADGTLIGVAEVRDVNPQG